MKQENMTAENKNFRPLNLQKKLRPAESAIQVLLFLAGVLSIFVTIAIVYELGKEAMLFFTDPDVTLAKFLGTTKWQPGIGQYGIWALVSATLVTSFIAISISLPLGLAAAIYLSEYASFKSRSILKPILEVLAGIPTVVYGYFALLFVTPVLKSMIGDQLQVYNMLSAGIVMGIMILPLISSMSEDALSAVPRSLREAAYAMGATKVETSLQVVVPAALSGIGAALIVGISRAVGETMIVAVASGSGPNFSFNPLDAAETMTGHIARISGGDLSYNSIDYTSLFAIAMMLFLLTLVLNLISQWVVSRFRERYE
ncbi:MAG TPA: phosphate ABC transporter permease subunit PstC [Anaerolineales bacterium]|nr:phosphate ABC transporter permease subunit PstC [Anaerolineales bacterium]HMV96594.1 phosphate ABC transporter permease subunit PstC [Anaerolineales bacterium]HMX19934.1 phosphate ABC transporter permease subunit PstC [Anaerolineales bacterium]HMX75371.1 phosphate ABC transporter permease subunit PstC [Anaerolineales bacterium]HMZ44957.1 phosphate ABC transporter permease subunit PstC [Anaerolineales bacterium]